MRGTRGMPGRRNAYRLSGFLTLVVLVASLLQVGLASTTAAVGDGLPVAPAAAGSCVTKIVFTGHDGSQLAPALRVGDAEEPAAT